MIRPDRFIWLSIILLLIGCSPSAEGARPRPGRTLTIFAAASLTDAFAAMATAFQAEHPEVEIVFNFAGSQTLRLQIEQGAQADVLASANLEHIATLQAAKLVGSPVLFARNQLVVILPQANPGRIETLAALAKPALKLVLAGPEVPVGRYARQALANLNKHPELSPDFSSQVLANLVSEEENVRGVVAKVQLGEADAGIVYSSDVAVTNTSIIKTLAIPPEFNVVADYPIALVSESDEAEIGQAFIDFILSAPGQAILVEYGFQPLRLESRRGPEPANHFSRVGPAS